MENKKLCIATDMDGVICSLEDEFLVRLERDHGITLPSSEWKTHKIAEQFPEVPRSWVDEQLADPAFWLNAKCREDAWHMFNKWFMAGNDVFIVTARGKHNTPTIKSLTERWLDEWEINYNRLFMDEPHLEKWKRCLELKADLFIEDNPDEIASASEHISSYIVDHPYNRCYNIKDATRIDDLYSLDKLISEQNKV